MKKILIPLLLLASIVTCTAQETSPEEKINKNQIGLNATFFITQFLSLNSGPVNQSPYALTYRRMLTENRAFRFGLGATFQKLNNNSNFINTQSQLVNVDTRVGIEFQKQMSKRWRAYTGIDAIFGYSKNEFTSNNGFDLVTTINTIKSFGGGPVLGLFFLVNKNISLSTESTLYMTYSDITNEDVFQTIPGNSREKDNALNLGIVVPTTIYFNFMF